MRTLQFIPLFLFLVTSLSLSAQGTSSEPDPNAFVTVDQEPVPLNMDTVARLIGYPPEAKQKEIEGKVIIRLLVSSKGEYIRHIVVKNPNDLLTNAVTAQLHKIRYSPAMLDGKPLMVWITIPFEFSLQRSEPEKRGKKKKYK